MKVKFDFVTNSSSASFVVIGASLNKSEIVLQRGPESGDIYNFIDKIMAGTDLDYSFGDCRVYDGDDVMIGIQYTKMKDDETLGDFKERVRKQIKDAFGVDVIPGHIEECWMDN